MPETQGRGPEYDDARIERAAKRAHENGHDDASIRAAARDEFGSAVSTEVIDAVRRKLRALFN